MMFKLIKNFCDCCIRLFINVFVRVKTVPDNPVKMLHISKNKPTLYVLPYESKTDLMVLNRLCESYHISSPLKTLKIGDASLPAYLFIDKSHHVITSKKFTEKLNSQITSYIKAIKNNNNFELQILPVSIMFNRNPDAAGQIKSNIRILSHLQRFFKIIFSGRDCHARFSDSVLINQSHDSLLSSNEQVVAIRFQKIMRFHFARQRIASNGPRTLKRKPFLYSLLENEAIKESIEEEAKTKKISFEAARKNALVILDEVAADYKYKMLRITDIVLDKAWSRLYQGLKITNAEPVRKLAENGHEIIYAPCHRSHMDYLLLSFVLFRQGLVPPHIAAGINLDFWPAGPIFRRLGAFFIRRSFKGNKLYTTIFREYLSELFDRGYSVEYFIEGGRSRTGRLLSPKTGMLMMTMQSLLRGGSRPITIVPVYIGYEHVIEVTTYENELLGAKKKKESLFQTLKGFLKLKKLGYGYVNFGKPIGLHQFLNQNIPNWRESVDPTGNARPRWLTPSTNLLATNIMQNINSSASVNAMNLCVTLLLAAKNHQLSKKELIDNISLSILILKEINYANSITFPNETAETLFEHARSMGKFVIIDNGVNEIIKITKNNASLLTYYRNNIQHLIIVPAIISLILIKNNRITKNELFNKLMLLYPFIKAELFIYYEEESLLSYVDKILISFKNHHLINLNDNLISINETANLLQLIAKNADDCLLRYAIAFSLYTHDFSISRVNLEKEAGRIAKQYLQVKSIKAPEFYDKVLFSTITATMREKKYFNIEDEAIKLNVVNTNQLLRSLITDDALKSIDNMIESCNEQTDKNN